MYITEEARERLTELGILTSESRCIECDRMPEIIWHGSNGVILVCAEHSQYISTQLLKHVRSFELTTGLSVKVTTEIIDSHWKPEQLFEKLSNDNSL